VQYTNDFGAPRSQGAHQGIDILAARKAPVVAAEDGTVKFWTTSATAGCMLYLYGKSGTTYLYIHLNNDLTNKNDNRGKCVAGTAFAPGLKTGQQVRAGQFIGYVGDSGDADGGPTHLHFELHPHDGAAISPFAALNSGLHLLFAAATGKTFRLALRGTVSLAGSAALRVKVASLRSWPGNVAVPDVKRTLSLKVALGAIIQQVGASVAATAARDLGSSMSALRAGTSVVVWTLPAAATLDAQLGKNGSLAVDRVVVTATKPKT
jgi:Peptidase family M23